MGDEYKNEEVYVTDHASRITDHALRITDHALLITDHASRHMSHMNDKTVCIVGLGYVGLPLAKAFSKHLKTIGFDVDNEKIRLLNNNNNTKANIEFTTDPSKIKHADFVIIAVPTPITKSKEPDLRYVKSAVETVGKNLKRGATVVLESTVYPGVTEEVVAPINFRTGIKNELQYCIDESIYIRNAIGKEVGQLTK